MNPSDHWIWFIGIMGAVLTILNVIDKINTLRKQCKVPEEVQNEKIQILEKEVEGIKNILEKYHDYFTNDKERLDLMEKETKQVNTIMIKSLQALTEHALNGNNTEQLHECSKEMNEYLITK